MAVFAFESRGGASVLPSQWLMTWSSEFNSEKFPEDVYQELVARGAELSDADFDVLGAWKDGALRHGVEREFGKCSVAFTGSWRPNAVAAYTVWRSPSEPFNLDTISRPRGLPLFSESHCQNTIHKGRGKWSKTD